MNKRAMALIVGLSGVVSAAHAELVVVGHPTAAPLTIEQVSDIFLGKTTAFVPLDLPESQSIRAEFYKKATGKEPGQVKALWARLAFTGKAPPPREMSDATAVKKALASDAKAVGYIDRSQLDGSVKVLLSLN